MEHFQTIMSYATVACLVLACIVVTASLYKTRKSYWTALGCYSALTIVLGFSALLPHLLGIAMANSFGPSNVPGTGYILPILTLIGFLYPTLSLYPFISGKGGRMVAFAFAGLSVAFAMGSFVTHAVRWPLTPGGSLYYEQGAAAVFQLLLWLRVYDLRAATETK